MVYVLLIMSISYSIDRSNPAFGYETIKVAGQTSVILTKTYITQDQRYLFSKYTHILYGLSRNKLYYK
jgi:hypothetical protein